MGIAIIIVTLATQLRSSAGFMGVSLVALMGLSDFLTMIVFSWTQLETSIGAISRLKGFSEDIKSEHLESEVERPGETWPEEGTNEIRDICASYE